MHQTLVGHTLSRESLQLPKSETQRLWKLIW